MSATSTSPDGPAWSSRFVFIMASVGAAVGLANIWKFPYTAGNHGGGAFVLVYLAAIALLSLPVLITELVIGRIGNAHGPSAAIANVARASGLSSKWQHVALPGILASFVALSFYFVITGWVTYYALQMALGQFNGLEPDQIATYFQASSTNPALTTLWHTIAVVVTWLVVLLGVRDGVERVARVCMPTLFVLVIVNVVYAGLYGDMARAIRFLFDFDLQHVTAKTVAYAGGQAFFTLGAGSCVMVVFGSHLTDDVSIVGSSVRIALLDTLVALLAGLATFPLVFAHGLGPEEGPGLLFVTLPIVFAHSPGGALIGSVFFVMVALAALTSAIAIAQPPVAFVQQRFGWTRLASSSVVMFSIWSLGLATVCSFSSWQSFYPLAIFQGMLGAFEAFTVFEILEFVSINVLLPLGSLLLAVFVGWLVPLPVLLEAFDDRPTTLIRVWYFIVKFALPPLVLLVLVAGFLE